MLPAYMFKEDQHGPRTTGGSPPVAKTPSPISSRFDQFEKRQNEIWRLTFFVLFVLGVAFAWTSLSTIRSLAHHYEARLIGRPLSEFVQEGTGEGAALLKLAMPRFIERRHWTGVVEVQLKNQSSPFFFDCVAHAMMRDDKIHGITVLARDVSALRRNETRFTDLFESLQEGIYISTPEGNLVDANPALVRMLGYDSKEELLERRVPEILVDREERKLVKDLVESQPKIQSREILDELALLPVNEDFGNPSL